MPETLWMLLFALAVMVPIAVLVQDRYKNQTMEEEARSCFEQKEKLTIESSQLKQQMTQIKKQQHESDRESRKPLTTFVALEENQEKLEDERLAWDDEGDRLAILKRQFKQQHDVCRSKLEAIESTTIEEKFRCLRAELDVEELRTELLQCKVKSKTLEVSPRTLRSDDRSFKTEVPTNGNYGYEVNPAMTKRFKTNAALQKNEMIRGIANLNEDLFAVTSGSNAIERFDFKTLTNKTAILFKGFHSIGDIQPCGKSESLFVLDEISKHKTAIVNVDPYNKVILGSWIVNSHIARLTVTENCHVLIAIYHKNTINEYSSTGQLILETVLKPDTGIVRPQMALKMADGNFLVSYHGNHPSGVSLSILNASGDVVKSYSRSSNLPEVVNDVVLDGHGNILVAEMLNGRVLLLSADLQFRRVILSMENGIRLISVLLLDKENGRLFLADFNINFMTQKFENGRIVVFDMFYMYM